MIFFKNLFAGCRKHQQADNLAFLAFMKAPVATLITDDKGVILQANHCFFKLTGYENTEVLGEYMSILKSGKHTQDFYKNLWHNIMEVGHYNFEIWNRCKDNTILLMKQKILHIQDQEKPYFIATFEDITEEKKLSDHYQYLATHDSLTGLANRTLLNDRFSQACLNALRSGKKMSIVLCDLNEFKQLNDTYGHQVGDTVLQEVATKLKQLVRASDTVARYGGDEFMIILEQLDNNDDVEIVLNKINSIFPTSLEIAEALCSVSMSIGHASFPEEGITFEQLVSMADTKMYEAKNNYYGYL